MLSMQSSLAARLEECATLAVQGELGQASEQLLELSATAENWETIDAFLAKVAQQPASGGLELNRRLGAALARQERFEAALACWRRVEEHASDDREAACIVSKLTIDSSRQRAGQETRNDESQASQGTLGERKAPARKPQADPWYGTRREVSAPAPTPAPPTEIALTETQLLEKAVRDCPSHPDNYLQLVPLYLAKGRDFDAERVLAKGREATEDDPAVRRLWEDVLMLRLKKKVERARQQVAQESSDKVRAELDELVASRDRLESEIFHSRCRREPNNAALRFELGLRLKRAGDLREAYKRFQEALPDAAQKCAAAFEMGECLREFGEFPEALRHYRLSAESAVAPRDGECQRRALHQAARIAVQIKLPRVAQRYLTELLRLDPNCLPAKELLREIQKP